MYSIFPKDENNIFVNIDDLFYEQNVINFKIILYCIHETSAYPYVSFLLKEKESMLHFLESKMSSISEMEDMKTFINETISPYELIDINNVKCYVDIYKKQAYIMLEYKPLNNIVDYEKQYSICQALSYEIANIKKVDDKNIHDSCYDFFLRHNYLLYVKEHKKKIRFPIPIPVYKGTKRKYINDVIPRFCTSALNGRFCAEILRACRSRD